MGMVPHQTLELMLDKLEDTYGNTRRTVESQIILEKPDSHGTRTKQQGKQRSSEGLFFSNGVRQETWMEGKPVTGMLQGRIKDALPQPVSFHSGHSGRVGP